MNTETQINIEKDVNVHLENKKVSRTFFAFIWILYAVVYMTKNCYNGALASIVSEGILTKSQTGFITAMFYAVYAPLQIVGGMASDKYSPERLIKIGLVGAALSNAVIFFNQNYYTMLAVWMFNGAIQFGIWPSVFKIVSSQLVRSDRGSMVFFILFSSTAGLILSYLIAAIVPNWEYNFAISAIVLFVFAIILHIYEKYLNPLMKWDSNVKPYKAKRADNIGAGDEPSTSRIFIESGFYFMLVATVLSFVVSQSRMSLTPIMLVENYDNISPQLGNLLNIILIISGVIGNIIAGKLFTNVKNQITAMICLFATMLAPLIVCVFVGSVSTFSIIASMCLVACIETMVNLNRSYYTMSFSKYGKSGTAAGVLNAGQAVSCMIAAYAMPLISENFGWRTLVISWPALIVVSIIVLLPIVKKYRRFKKCF